MRNHRRILYRTLLAGAMTAFVLIAVFVGRTATGAATTITDNYSVPISYTTFVSCAGEYVLLRGDIHLVSHTTFDNRGGAHISFHSNYQNVSGVGQTSGDKYRVTGGSHYTFNARSFPFTTTSVTNFQVIGQGPNNNFTVHANLHITINANGELTAYVTNYRSECRSKHGTPTTGPYPGPTTPTPTSNPYPGPTTPTPTSNPYPGPTTPTPTGNPYPGTPTATATRR